MPTWRAMTRLYRLKVRCRRKIAHARFVRATRQRTKRWQQPSTSITTVVQPNRRCCPRMDLMAALDHRRGVRDPSRANIVDAQIFMIHPMGARSTPLRCRARIERDEDEVASRGRASTDVIEKASCPASQKLPQWLAKRGNRPKVRLRGLRRLKTRGHHQQPAGQMMDIMIEVSGLDDTGLLYELTTMLSKLNLNIASAHAATFGERVVDAFDVMDCIPERQIM